VAVAALAAVPAASAAPLGLRTPTTRDLAVMVLPQAELGPDFAAYDLWEGSGPVANPAAAEGTPDPGDTAATLAAAGRLAGYELEYARGLVSVETGVERFRDEVGAQAHLERQAADLQRLEGEDVGEGVRLSGVRIFAVDGLGDAAVGMTARASFAGSGVRATIVSFRLGTLAAAATIVRPDDADVGGRVTDLARSLERRMLGVLRGEVTGPPVALPRVTAAGAPAAAAPALPAMALRLADLPEATLTRAGYVRSDTAVAEFHREFGLSRGRLGRSRPTAIESQVDLAENAATAHIQLDLLRESGERVFLKDFDSLFRGKSDVELRGARVKRLDVPKAGDESVTFRATAVVNDRRFTAVFTFVRVGRVVGLVNVYGFRGPIYAADVLPLARRQAARTRAVLARG
jgi:hypothetical protein